MVELHVSRQARKVLRHLEQHGSISNMEALIVYSIPRLAACVYELRKQGFTVVTDVLKDAQGHKYSRYSMKLRRAA